MGLGYTHLSPNMLAHLHTSYASQLENAGLWQWAVFVALHMNEDQRYCWCTCVIYVQSDCHLLEILVQRGLFYCKLFT